jgi:hypothetical protein
MNITKIIKLTIAGVIAILLTGGILYMKLKNDQQSTESHPSKISENQEAEKTVEQQQLEDLDKIRTQEPTTVISTPSTDSATQTQELDKLRKESKATPTTQQEIDDQLKALDALRKK